MKVRHVDCPGCGAPLSLPKDETRGTCGYCGATLDVTVPPVPPAERHDSGPLRDRLLVLDENWRDRRRSFEVENDDGTRSVSTTFEARWAMICQGLAGGAMTFLALVIFGLAMSDGSVGGGVVGLLGAAAGVLIVAAGVVIGRRNVARAATHAREKAEYERERRRLLDEIAAGAES